MSNEWWRGGVIYQVYPRSFQDSTGNGSGDLNGISKRLPYIADLGADAVWISPFFKSPMKDFGYDVSDYCDVDPSFGTLADFDALIKTAHDLGLKIIIDLVLSHTSDQHAWFQESRASKTNDKSDWYVWADPQPDGTPPTNWLSIFGGSAWAWHGGRQQYYMHNFLVEQPDLNFHNPAVQDAVLDVAQFWLDRGVDGFRLDTINFYFHDAQLRSNPALPPEERNDDIAPSVNPYNHQNHLYDKNQPENLEFLRRLRALMDRYEGRAAVGEVGDAQYGLDIVGQYTSGGDKVHMCYAFDFLSPKPLTSAKVRQVLTDFETSAPDGWPCWALSNHDVVRHMTRLAHDNVAHAKVLAALMLTLRGSASVYQGEELGLPEADVAFEKLQDPYGIEFWPEFKGRDGCRTPMVWDKSNTGGFSPAESWLPVDDRHLQLSAEAQQSHEGSMLAFYRDFLSFRAEWDVFKDGSIEFTETDSELLTFKRVNDAQAVFCALNLTGDTQDVVFPAGAKILKSVGFDVTVSNTLTKMPPYTAIFTTLEERAR